MTNPEAGGEVGVVKRVSFEEMTILPDPASVSVIANGTGNTVVSSLARLGHSSHSNVRHHSVSDSMFSSEESFI